MTNSRTFTLIILLSIFMKRSQTRGDQVPETQQNAVKQLTEFKELTFMEGSDVTLRCGNVTAVTWNEFIYIVWNISSQGRKCWLGLSPELDTTCNDGKMLYNTSDGISLIIPKISLKDEGFYFCDFAYKGGSHSVNVSLSVIKLSTHVKIENGERFAVCEAKYKTKVPTLHWEHDRNVSVKKISMGTFSVMENRVNLDNVTLSEITCVATYPSGSGSEQKKSTLHLTKDPSLQDNSLFPMNTTIAISVCCVCFILVSLAMVYFLHIKLNSLSALKMLCCKSKISHPAEDKPPQPTDVEEVEPYASYIQRVNSIYNSSAELFNA